MGFKMGSGCGPVQDIYSREIITLPLMNGNNYYIVADISSISGDIVALKHSRSPLTVYSVEVVQDIYNTVENELPIRTPSNPGYSFVDIGYTLT